MEQHRCCSWCTWCSSLCSILLSSWFCCSRSIISIMRHKKLFLIIMIPISIGIIYYFFSPTEAKWMPKCIFKVLTGWDCAACGNQRALHAFLHGHIVEAFHYNPFSILSIPYLALVAYTTFFTSPLAVRWRKYVQHRITILTYLVLLILWWIGRNIFF